MSTIEHLLKNNEAWAQQKRADDPDFFKKMVGHQSPDYLWIGCSDSRVPAEMLVGLSAGDMFVHRNIANQVGHTDLNVLSVIQYAVEVLKVQHIIVCGHYDCGGIKAAMGDGSKSLVDDWLLNVKDVCHKYSREMNVLKDDKKRHDLMCELNVIEQIRHLSETSIVSNAWKNGQSVTVHGWVYQIKDGHIKTLGVEISGPDELDLSCRQAMKRSLSA